MKRKIRNAFWLYLLLWIVVFVVFTLFFASRNRNLAESAQFFFDIAWNTTILIAFHVLYLSGYALYRISLYFIKIYRNKGRKIFIKQLSFRFVVPILLLVIGLKTLVYVNANEWHTYAWNHKYMNTTGKVNNLYKLDKKQRGMSVF